MSILGDLFHKIFPASHPANQTDPAAVQPGAAPAAPEAAQPPVDIDAVLTEMQSKHPQTLNWKTSIVDLMKLVGLDSSLEHRKQLAKELNFTGDTNDSASMNVWLHQQVMRKMADNGGKVPAGL